MSFTIDKVTADNFEMAYLRFGCGKRTLVILPGLSVQSVLPAAAAIEKQYEIFCESFTVYLFDRRTDLPPVYTVENMADDTAVAMKALGLKNCCIFGTSQGGMIAMTIAARYPELAGKLALGSTAARMDESNTAVIDEWVSLAKKKDKEGLCLSFGETVYPPAMFQQYRNAFTAMAKTLTDADLQRFITLAGNTGDFDLTDELAQIQCPVLAIGDTDDRVLGKASTLTIAELLKYKPDFTFFMYEGYGHAVYDAAPDYPRRLFDFFQQP